MSAKYKRLSKCTVSVLLSILMLISSLTVGFPVNAVTTTPDEPTEEAVKTDIAADTTTEIASDIKTDTGTTESTELKMEAREKVLPQTSGATDYTFYFVRPDGWSGSNVSIHVFRGNTAYTTWNSSNSIMSQDSITGLYTKTVSCANTPTGIVFYDKKNHYQTSDITSVTNGNIYYTTGSNSRNMTGVNSGVSYTSITSTINSTTTDKTVYFVKPSTWGTPNAYAWFQLAPNEKNAAWSGVAMTQVSGNLYSYTYNKAYDRIIFNDSSNQTANLTIEYDSSGNLVYNQYTYDGSSGSWGTYTPPAVEPDDWYIIGRFSANNLKTGSSGGTYWDVDSTNFHMTAVDGQTDLYKYETNATLTELAVEISSGNPNQFGFKKAVNGSISGQKPWAYNSSTMSTQYLTANMQHTSSNDSTHEYTLAESTHAIAGRMNNGIQLLSASTIENTKNVVFYLDTSGSTPVFYFELVDKPVDTNSFAYLKTNPPSSGTRRVFVRYADAFAATWTNAPALYAFTYGTANSELTTWQNSYTMTRVTHSPFSNLYYYDVTGSFDTVVIRNGTSTSGKQNQTIDRTVTTGDVILLTIHNGNQSRDGQADGETKNYNKRRDIDCEDFNISNVSSDGSDIKIFAKNGTIRHDNVGGEYDRFSRMATTTITKGSVSGSTYLAPYTSNSTAKVLYAQPGSQVVVTTTIGNTYSSNYKVEGFVVNGVTYTPDHVEGAAYSFTLDIADVSSTAQYTNKYIEITPVYFLKDESKAIKFYVKNIDSSLAANWSTVSSYSWYGDGHVNDTLAYNDTKKSALGGYPGQPMLKSGEYYYTQVPKTNDASEAVQGVTLNNYVFDDIHAITLGVFNDSRRGANYQTYDYDDFAALAASKDNNYKGATTIICDFKYETARDNFYDIADSTGNVLSTVTGYKYDDTGYSGVSAASPNTEKLSDYDSGNGWEVLTDVNGAPVDVFANLLSDRTISQTFDANNNNAAVAFKTASEVESYAASSGAGVVHIISDGYSSESSYIGSFGTMWYVYGSDGTYLGKLPPSAFLYSVTTANSTLPPSAPTNFLSYSTKATSSKKEDYWATYKNIYNSKKVFGRPTLITYEQTRRGGGRDSWGTRTDVRWYYSTPTPITGEVVIQYKPTSASDYITDKFNTGKNTGIVSNIGAYFTNNEQGYYLNGKTKILKSDNALSSDSKNFEFKVTDNSFTIPSGSTNEGTYIFKGWYVQVPTSTSGVYNYESVNKGSKLYSDTGAYPFLTDTVFVARYEQVNASDILTISHQLLSDAPDGDTTPTVHKGTGTPKLTVTLTTPSGGTVTKIKNSTSAYNFTDIKAAYNSNTDNLSSCYITVSLATDVTLGNIDGVYRRASSTSYLKSGKVTGEEETVDTLGTIGSSGSDNSIVVTYTIPFTTLFTTTGTNAGTLNYNTLPFYTDINTPTIELTFKYYDRSIVTGKTATISDSPKELKYTITGVNDYESLRTAIREKFNTPAEGSQFSMSKLENILDKYYIWFSQGEAESQFGTMDYYYVDGLGNLAKTTYDGLNATDYSNSAEDRGKFTYASIKSYHTTWASQPQTATSNDGKWVTYYNGNTEVTPTGTETVNGYIYDVLSAEQIASITKITVWAFNTPKEYNIHAYTNNTTTVNGETVFTGTGLREIEGEEGLYTFGANDIHHIDNNIGFYNQRVGDADTVAYANINKDKEEGKEVLPPSDGASKYLKDYFGMSENTQKFAYNGIIVDAPATAKVSAESSDTYYFDGWYSFADDGSLMKISSDRNYGNRIVSDLTMYPVYKATQAPSEPTFGGVVLTKNGVHNTDGENDPDAGVDFYVEGDTNNNNEAVVDSGELKVRLNNQLNVYYNGKTIESDPQIGQVAVIYVKVDDGEYDEETGTLNATNLSKITTWLNDHHNFLTKGSKPRRAGWVNFGDPDSQNPDDWDYNYLMIDTYTVKHGTGDGDISLTEKNRIQFVQAMTEEQYNGAYDNLVVFCAVQYDGIWHLSDNYVSYLPGWSESDGTISTVAIEGDEVELQSAGN